MTPEKLKELRSSNKIIGVAGKLGLLKKPIDENSKSSYNVSCPNISGHQHDDQRPSLALLPKYNKYHCYGCGIDGDVISLVELTLGKSFQEAIKWLDPNAELFPSHHQEAKNYLKEKGLIHETLKKFEVYVGETWNEDTKYECVYFPIATGMKYRLFNCPNCKYKNGIGAGACLFKTIDNPPSDLVVICEGELDAMAGWQATNYPFWTSTGGANTFLKDWVAELTRFNQIIVGFDNDEPGKLAALNAIKILTDNGIDLNKIIQIEVPELLGKDWCDYFSAGMKKDNFDELINLAVSAKRGIG